MKQRITPEQANQLTNKQKYNLLQWWKPKLYQLMTNSYGHRFYIISLDKDYLKELYGCLPLLSIGQMFEILDGNLPKIEEREDGRYYLSILLDGMFAKYDSEGLANCL